MNWFFIALLAPALWSVTNHIDKYLISKYFRGGGTGSLMIFSSLIGLFVVPFVYVFHPNVFNIQPTLAILIAFNGFLYVLGLLPYIYALQKDEASIVVPLFQTIPVFSYVLAYFVLGETLTTQQIIASMLVILGAITLSLDLTDKKPKFKKVVFGLMFLSSFMVALNGLIFKFVAIQADFWTTSFWEYVGFALLAFILFTFIKSYREQFLSVVKANKVPVLSLNALNEVINIIAKLSMNFATLLAPLALVWVVNGFQPFFVLLYGVVITLFFPKFGTESLLKKHLIQKVIAILIMFVGVYFLNG
ncbi:MAG: EamA family transporter [Candidatus Daviesbacteria bacterium]|nr:EamA family transporter [Candidatus Daviesbacteria bacterium]